MKNNQLNVEALGQVFTQDHTVDFMLTLLKNKGEVLEPSCGAGAFSNKLKKCTAIELDKTVCPHNAINMDFFEFSSKKKFSSAIANFPFVKYNNIFDSTKLILQDKYSDMFDERSNLYLFFIYKTVHEHLTDDGELVIINPRESLKATSAIKLNNYLFNNGTITDFIDLGDARLFGSFTPNCVIWRWEKGNLSHKTNYSTAEIKDNKLVVSKSEIRKFQNMNGQLVFTKNDLTVPFNKLFEVKVGAVSGADDIFAHTNGNRNFVTSETVSTGKTKKFIYNKEDNALVPFKADLLKRGIKKFNEDSWYMWGRNNFDSTNERIYVNCKTRKEKPFFHNKCKNYDGSILGLFLKNQKLNINSLIEDLNNVDWNELGFQCGNRFIFSQKALENSLLPPEFEKYLLNTGPRARRVYKRTNPKKGK